jgi:hypothetical protein
MKAYFKTKDKLIALDDIPELHETISRATFPSPLPEILYRRYDKTKEEIDGIPVYKETNFPKDLESVANTLKEVNETSCFDKTLKQDTYALEKKAELVVLEMARQFACWSDMVGDKIDKGENPSYLEENKIALEALSQAAIDYFDIYCGDVV